MVSIYNKSISMTAILKRSHSSFYLQIPKYSALIIWRINAYFDKTHHALTNFKVNKEKSHPNKQQVGFFKKNPIERPAAI